MADIVRPYTPVSPITPAAAPRYRSCGSIYTSSMTSEATADVLTSLGVAIVPLRLGVDSNPSASPMQRHVCLSGNASSHQSALGRGEWCDDRGGRVQLFYYIVLF